VEIDLTTGPIPNENPCSWEMRYRSVICSGTAVFLSDPDEKTEGLNCILEHYHEKPHTFSEQSLGRVCVIRVDVETMTGKKHGY
jgi:nitroimidazol reductase NimA-like FMN-containing flavoprotein (pyridoxamine 5'-phosphate oxidase superfamily)